MAFPTFLAIGLISGTSADSIDAVLVESDGKNPPILRSSQEFPYPPTIREKILSLYHPGETELDRCGALDRTIGELFAQAALALCQHAGIDPTAVDVIGSHGQTVRHRPPLFTMQIGNPFFISGLTGITTIADFRPADLVRNGEGAPLTPLFHRCLFQQPGRSVAVLNLGGIANLTALPADPSLPLIAGDCGPANSLMDLLVNRLSHGSLHHDHNGAWAAQGEPHAGALAWLAAHPFLARPFPKSTGREEFGTAFLDNYLAAHPDLTPADHLATLTQFTVDCAARACRQLLPPMPGELVLCGGGAKNGELVRRLQISLPETLLVESSQRGVNADLLEAQAFAWFAVRTLRLLPSSLPEATGARSSAVLGAFYPGNNWNSLQQRCLAASSHE